MYTEAGVLADPEDQEVFSEADIMVGPGEGIIGMEVFPEAGITAGLTDMADFTADIRSGAGFITTTAVITVPDAWVV